MLAVLVAAGTGCASPGSGQQEECGLARDCGSIGDAVCAGGQCLVFDEADGHGGAVVDLSFNRDLYAVARSGYVWFILGETPGGDILSCQEVLQGQVDLQAASTNQLQVNPKYLVLHWDTGGTFFPNNLVQFIRPSSGVVAVAEAYQLLEGEGSLTAIGCQDGIEIVKDRNADVVIPLDEPQWL